MSGLLSQMDDVSPQWLTRILQRAGCLETGSVQKLSVMPQETNTAIVSPLRLTYSGDAPEQAPANLFLKIMKPGFPSNMYTTPAKEVVFYTQIARAMDNPPTLRCYDAAFDQQTGQGHLLFEDISASHVEGGILPPTRPQCELVVDALARVHAFWWNDPRLGKELGPVMDVGSFLQFFGMSFPGYLQFLGERLFDDERKMYEAILTALPRLWEKRLKPRLEARRHLTLIHMDFHFANVLLPRTPGSDDIRLIDWASWNIYMGAQDLAYAIGLHWSPKRRKVLEADMVKLYHQRLLAHGVEDYSWEECWDDYRISIIVNVLSPILRWAMFDEAKTGWWWGIVERTLQAFEDLDCAELLA